MTLGNKFAELGAKGEKALVLYVTAGDPALDQLPAILETLADAGADVLEVGIPFSDPIADGPTIQASSQRALDREVTPSGVLEALSKARLNVPVVLMGYANPMLRMGYSSFAKAASEAGACAVIVCDMTPDEAGDWVSAARAHSIDTVFLAAPTSTGARLDAVAKHSTGFIYAVSRTGVTGARDSVSEDAASLVSALTARTDKPVCVGFGIAKPEQVDKVCRFASGAVVGSALVTWLAENWRDGQGRAALTDWVRALKAGTKPS